MVSARQDMRNGFSCHMEREIFEQVESVMRTMHGRVDFKNKLITLNGIESFVSDISRSRRIILIGAASSYHVAIACRQIMEELIQIPVFVELVSDFLDRKVPIFRDDVCIMISQSGETSSVLSACRYCKQYDALLMGITNEEKSTLSQETHFGININAGVEVGVTSTKTYTSEFIALVMFALKMASDKKSMRERVSEVITEMEQLPRKISRVLQLNSMLKSLAHEVAGCSSLLVMGRGYHQATSLEGSFKFKEIVNIHSEAIHSGELKHGPLALIDQHMPIIMIIMRDRIYDKCVNALEQVKARGGCPHVLCEEDDAVTQRMVQSSICIPKTADCLTGVLAVIPFQLIAMHLAKIKGKDVDSPSLLQKTVVE